MDANENLLGKPLVTAASTPTKAAFRWKAAGIALLVGVGAVWLMRIPIANLAIRGYLDGRGIQASFEGDGLSPVRLEVRDLRLGPNGTPDLTAERAVVRLSWHGLAPEVSAVELYRPVLKARLDAEGLSLGSLDIFLKDKAKDEPFALPGLDLYVRHGRVDLTTPLGLVVTDINSQGRVDSAFRLEAQTRSVTLPGRPADIDGLTATTRLTVAADGIAADLSGRVQGINEAGQVAGWLRTGSMTFSGEMQGKRDLSRMTARFAGEAQRIARDMSGASAVTWDLNLKEVILDRFLAPKGWDGTITATAAAARLGGMTIQAPRAQLDFVGRNGKGTGQWTMATNRGSWFGGTLGTVQAQGKLNVSQHDGDLVIGADGKASLIGGSIAPSQRAAVRDMLTSLSATPLGPLTDQAAGALDRAMQNFRLDVPLGVQWQKGFGELVVPDTVEASGQGGVRFSMSEHDAPVARIELPAGRLFASGRASLSGSGLPKLEARMERLAVEPGELIESAGVLVVDAWKSGPASLSLTPVTYRLRREGEVNRLSLTGQARMTGPIPSGRVEDLRLPLDLDAVAGKDFRLTARDGCLSAQVGALVLGSYRFGAATLPLCPAGKSGLVTVSENSRLAGGIAVDTLAFPLEGNQNAGLSAGPLSLVLGGTTARPALTLALDKAAFRMGNGIVMDGARIAGQLTGGEGGWHGTGTMGGMTVLMKDAGVRATVGSGWRVELADAAAPLKLNNITAQLTDLTARPRFHSLLLGQGQARIGSERASFQGQVRLARTNDLLGTVEAQHGFTNGQGELTARLSSLTFSPTLQPYQLSELARGVVENVTGSVGGFVRTRWSEKGLAADGQVDLKNVSMATAALGPIEGISGEIRLTDLMNPTTPPGQQITIAKLNPGIAMENGMVRFQLLGNQRMRLEAARWPLAGGRLAVRPATLALSDAEKRVTLELDSVDLETFIKQMDIKNFHATGAVEGVLPLVITKDGAAIRGGQIRAKQGGGTIAYTGMAPGSDPNTKMAFDALKNFKFASIIIDVDGELAGNIQTSVRFEGTSRASISPLSWFRGLRAKNIPFKFNIKVNAPLRALMGSVSGITDVGGLIKRNVEVELERERAEREELEKKQKAQTPPQTEKKPSRRRK